DAGEIDVVGVNKFKAEGDQAESVQIHRNDEAAERAKIAELKALRTSRDRAKVEVTLAALETAARGTDNLMPTIRDAVRAYATVGEIADRLRRVFGEYRPPRGF